MSRAAILALVAALTLALLGMLLALAGCAVAHARFVGTISRDLYAPHRYS